MKLWDGRFQITSSKSTERRQPVSPVIELKFIPAHIRNLFYDHWSATVPVLDWWIEQQSWSRHFLLRDIGEILDAWILPNFYQTTSSQLCSYTKTPWLTRSGYRRRQCSTSKTICPHWRTLKSWNPGHEKLRKRPLALLTDITSAEKWGGAGRFRNGSRFNW